MLGCTAGAKWTGGSFGPPEFAVQWIGGPEGVGHVTRAGTHSAGRGVEGGAA